MLCAQRHLLDLLLRVDEGHYAATRAQNQLRLVLEHDLDDFVRVTQQDGLLGSFPLLNVDERLSVVSASWGLLLSEWEL